MIDHVAKASKAVYSNGVDHYLSKNRRDGVKVHWEEPFSRSVYKKAIDWSIGNESEQSTVRVMDLGCGTGDGYRLLAEATDDEIKEIQYVGLDASESMVETANDLYKDRPEVEFRFGDIRTDIPDEPFDLYLSCGVPYSHLTREEMAESLRTIFGSIVEQKQRAAVIIDVLGRYSIEWTPHWHETRWDYNMSFFAASETSAPTPMTFYGAEDLESVVRESVEAVGSPLCQIDYHDRSVSVGRHTATLAFNQEIPEFRNLINRLIDPESETDLSEMIFPNIEGDAPVEVLRFFDEFGTAWNQLIKRTAENIGESIGLDRLPASELMDPATSLVAKLEEVGVCSDPQTRASVLEPLLAECLRRLEQSSQPGLGVGHTLIAVAHIDATAL